MSLAARVLPLVALLAAAPATADWVSLGGPPTPSAMAPLITTATPGELVAASRFTPKADARTFRWEQGVADREFTRLVSSPDAAAVLYGITSGDQPLWRSVNSGHSWHELKAPRTPDSIKSVSAGPFASGSVYYVTTSGALFSSRDGGFTWQRHEGAANPGLLACDRPDNFLNDVFAHPAAQRVVFALVRCGLARSGDGGQSWRLVADMDSIAISAADGALYAWKSDLFNSVGLDVWRSRDLGSTWDHAGIAPRARVWPDRFEAGVLWSGRSDAFFRSTDGGSTWSPALAGITLSSNPDRTSRDVKLLFPLPGEPVAIDDAGFAYTWRGAQGWQSLPLFPGSPTTGATPAFAAREDGQLLWFSLATLAFFPGAQPMVNRYVWRNDSWTYTGLSFPSSLQARAATNDVFGLETSLVRLVGAYATRVNLLDQDGAGTSSDVLYDFCGVLAVAPLPLQLNLLVRCSGSGKLGTYVPGSGTGLRALSPPAPDIRAAAWGSDDVITFATPDAVYRNGERVSAANSPTSLAVHPHDPLHLFIAEAAGIRESRDGGRTWTLFDAGVAVSSALLSATSTALYAASAAGVFRCDGYRCSGGARARSDLVELQYGEPARYFLTADPLEIGALAGAGWQRTGEVIGAYAKPAPGTRALRRFVSPALGTHFETLEGTNEPGLLRASPDWIEEDSGASYVYDAMAGGGCAAGTPVWRLLDNGSDGGHVNHRYTTKASIRTQMLARGWLDEGVRFCAVAQE